MPHRVLRDWMKKTGRTQTELAREVPCNQTCVHRWLNRKERPSEENRARLELLSGGEVRADLWLTDGEREAMRRQNRQPPAQSLTGS